MLRRVAIFVLAFFFIVSVTMEMMPRAMAMPQPTPCPMGMQSSGTHSMDMQSEHADMSADADQSGAPCNKGLTPTCIDAMGCVVAVALPQAPLSAPRVLDWSEVTYSVATSIPASRSIPPDLFPPILAA
jgi:hypothetical protein